MLISSTPLPGVIIIDLEPKRDERGFLARTYCRETFLKHGMAPDFVQQSLSHTARTGIIRGMHYQLPPYEEDKLIRVVSGAVYDVALDLRRDSPAFKRWLGVELSAENRRALYLPRGVAHGYQALADKTEVLYQMSAVYHPDSARGVRWNDPAFGIDWPMPERAELNARDAAYPDFA